jgi:hypothetical protein
VMKLTVVVPPGISGAWVRTKVWSLSGQDAGRRVIQRLRPIADEIIVTTTTQKHQFLGLQLYSD